MTARDPSVPLTDDELRLFVDPAYSRAYSPAMISAARELLQWRELVEVANCPFCGRPFPSGMRAFVRNDGPNPPGYFDAPEPHPWRW